MKYTLYAILQYNIIQYSTQQNNDVISLCVNRKELSNDHSTSLDKKIDIITQRDQIIQSVSDKSIIYQYPIFMCYHTCTLHVLIIGVLYMYSTCVNHRCTLHVLYMC